jgi:hypothetical protein
MWCRGQVKEYVRVIAKQSIPEVVMRLLYLSSKCTDLHQYNRKQE